MIFIQQYYCSVILAFVAVHRLNLYRSLCSGMLKKNRVETSDKSRCDFRSFYFLSEFNGNGKINKTKKDLNSLAIRE